MGLERAFSVSDGGLGEEETKSRPCCSIAGEESSACACNWPLWRTKYHMLHMFTAY